MKNIFNFLFKSILILIPFFILILSILLWQYPYRAFTDFILELIDRKDLRLYWEKDLMPLSRYNLLSYVIFVLFFTSLIFSFFLWKRGYGIVDFLLSFATFIKNKILSFFKDLKQQSHAIQYSVLALFLFLIIRTFYNIHAYEVQYDEAWTYINFIDKGIIVSAISPHNNHILYTLFAAILNYLPLSGKYILRLPLVFFALLTLYLWLDYWRKNQDWQKAIYSSFILISLSPFMIYALYGRAYILTFAFSILQYIALEKVYIKPNENRKYYIFLLFLAQVLGIYALITYIYIALPAQLLILGFTKDYKTWFKINLMTILVLLVLYLPFLVTNGANILFAATQSTISTYTYAEHWGLFHKLSDWMHWGADFQYMAYVSLCLAFLGFFIAYKVSDKSMKFLALFAGTLLILPLLMFFYQPQRVWSLQIIAYAFLYSFILFQRKNQRSWQNSLFILIFLLLIIVQNIALYSHYEINWAKNLDREGQKIANILLKNNVNEIYTFSRYDKPLLEYYYARAHQPLRIIMPYRESKNYQPFGAKTYKSVILDREDYVPTRMDTVILQEKKYESIYKNERIEIYLAPSKK